MAITPVVSSSPPTSPTAAGKGQMGKEEFLKLLVAQLKHQDPTSPMDMNGMTEQMTQFSILEQLTNLAKSGEATSTSMARTEALGMLGATVSYADENGAAHSGVVEHVDVSGDKPTLTIGGVAGIDPADLTSIG